MKPAVLFVDDEPQVLDGLRDMLRCRRKELRTEFANGGAEALARLQAEPFDVVVSDMRMPGLDGAQLLERVRDEHPDAVRVILSGQANEEAVLRMVPVAHIALAKPCTGAQLGAMVARACAIRTLLEDPALRASVHGIGALPSPPAVAQELLAAVEADDLSAAALARIAERDVALAAKVLQLVNSGFFGVPQEITDLQRAVPLLGVDVLRTLAIRQGALREFRADPALSGFSLEAFEQRSRRVGRLASQLTKTGEDARTAGAAGLLHDVGALVLASRAPQRYSAALAAAAAAPDTPLSDAEAEELGVSHTAIGGYLLALWGLPDVVVEAVRHHHAPLAAPLADGPLDVVDAVRVAALICAPDRAPGAAVDARAALEAVAPPAAVDRWLDLSDEETS
jgi:HD-like signal output (HDOD) protein/ActR/RegA family two-component response regulator